ncbi:5-carboxymethyl-2-hydroxymuconate Delta-isomerase [Candidatus Halocynthiibacter alkanivorans]|uniref:5-carboxymethyl-2-hydroxymuconate Delta-isomerase n=1 Tax=Candidatus Halocynthiibacter alkanivorans TaxID=2267619 RepID=UPI000DF27F6E|nr:5-carboxymethyl-2-hydroxymuconate Delta-isomerase [Candidatus Halocynthiibacter alkanivorans]
MPHFVLEYSPDLETAHDMQTLCNDICAFAIETGAFPNSGAVKVRATAVGHAALGCERQDFLHATIRLLQGRSEEVQAGLTSGLLALLDEKLPTVANLSVEIKEITTATYAKRNL